MNSATRIHRKTLTSVLLLLQMHRMPLKQDPDWEIVDELPGEKKKPTQRRSILGFLKSKALWIGLLGGATLVILVPVFRVILQNLARAWWLWLGLALYWIWRRMKKNAQQNNRGRRH